METHLLEFTDTDDDDFGGRDAPIQFSEALAPGACAVDAARMSARPGKSSVGRFSEARTIAKAARGSASPKNKGCYV
jgi:hypothetical protein